MAEIGTITTLFLTAQGLRLQAKVQGKKMPLILTRAKIGYGYLQDNMDLKALTGLINEVPSHQTGEEGTSATVDLTRVYDDTEEGMAYVGVTVKNGDNPRFYLREFAIYAEDPDVGEICYGIANLGDEAPPISPYDKRNHIEYKYDFPTVIANANDVIANITLAADTPWEDFVRLENVVKGLSAATFFPTNAGVLLNITAEQVALWNNMISMLMKGAANGVAELDANGKVPSTQLPSYVDDVLNGTAQGVTETGAGTYSATGFILTGETSLCTPEDGKTYIDTATNIQYRWTGTVFVSMGSNLALGQTNRTAGRGDWTKTAYDHSQNPHAPTTAATQSAMGLMSAADKKKLDGIDTGAQTHKAPTSAEVTNALGYTPARSSHNHSISDITRLSAELQVTLGNRLELETARGKASFYNFTLSGWTEGESHVLEDVYTTFGAATFGASHGLPNCAQGSTTQIYVYLYVKNGVVMWDEWYSGYDADYSGDTMFDIGAYTSDYDRSTGNMGFVVSYVNDSAGEEETYSLREAIIELADRIRQFHSMS